MLRDVGCGVVLPRRLLPLPAAPALLPFPVTVEGDEVPLVTLPFDLLSSRSSSRLLSIHEQRRERGMRGMRSRISRDSHRESGYLCLRRCCCPSCSADQW